MNHRRDLKLRTGRLATFVVQLVVLGASFVGLRGFPLDDAWIHQVVARTFATTGTLGYLPGAFGSGSTSYAWALALAPAYWLHVDPVAWAFGVNALAWLVAGQALFGALASGRTALRPLEASFLTLAALGTGNVVWLVQSGMEAMLFVTLSIVVVRGLVDLGTNREGRALVTAAATAVLVWTRPEAAGIVVVIAVRIAWARARRRPSAIVLAGWALGVGSYALVNVLETGHTSPTTLAGRRWMWLAGEPALSDAARMESVGAQWLFRLRDYTLGTSSTVIVVIALVSALVGLVAFVRERSAGALLVVAWAAIHLASYLVLLPALGHGGRYEPLTMVVFGLLGARGLLALARLVVARTDLPRGRRAAVALVLAAVPCVATVGASVAVWRVAEPLAIEHVERTEAGLASVFDSLPADATIASFDIGASGFRTRRRLLDLGALTDPSVLPYLRNGTVWQWLKAHDVSYVAIPLGYDDAVPDLFNFGYRLHLFDNPAITLTPIAFLASPENVWLPGIAATMHSAPRQGIYRVTYPAPPPPFLGASDRTSAVVDDTSVLDREERRGVDYCARAMAAAGAPVEVRFGASDDPPIDARRIVGIATVRARFPSLLAAAGIEADRVLAEVSAPYLRAGDRAGAAEASMFVLAVMIRRHVDATFSPLLPPSPYPVPAKTPSPSTDDEPLAVVALRGPNAIETWLDAHPVPAPSDRDRYGRTALHVALERFDIHAIEVLIAHGIDLEARDGEGRTPLYLAAKRGFVEAAAALVAAGAIVDSSNGAEDEAPLSVAAFAAAPSLVENLLAHGAVVDRRNAWGQTALFEAARGPFVHSEAIVDLLLIHGADPHVVDRQGFGVLHVAAAHDELGVVRRLLRAGVDPAAVSAHGSTPLDVALENHADLAAEALFEADAPRRRSHLDPPLFQAAEAGDTDWLLHLLGSGFAPSLRVDGRTALDVARANGAGDVARLLERR